MKHDWNSQATIFYKYYVEIKHLLDLFMKQNHWLFHMLIIKNWKQSFFILFNSIVCKNIWENKKKMC